MGNITIDRAVWDSLLQQINRFARRKADAEDLLQSAYVKLMAYPRRALVENVPAFLFRTAINIDVDNYRRERFLASLAPEFRNDCENSPLQDEVLASRNRLERMEEGLAQLHARTREILLLHRLDKMKYREIAQRLDISQSAVEKHIAKGTLFLGKWMEGW